MSSASPRGVRGFTLIELLSVLLILALLALMSYRGLGAVMVTRDHIRTEAARWQHAQSFLTRFERDVRLALPRPLRTPGGSLPAWQGSPVAADGPQLAFTRFASISGIDMPQRVGYGLNQQHEIELWVWPTLDAAPGTSPARYAVLRDVTRFELQYLGADLVWKDAWPAREGGLAVPLAVRLRIVFGSGEAVVRMFALNS